MCGIVGLLRWSALDGDDPARVRRAADVLTHRGPDSSGLWHDAQVALGFRRLKVIDLSPAGDQPMANEDGAIHVVFNGEIYNYRELRDELRTHGHTFKSQSDTEVLVHGYEQWGEAMLPKLRGMFAFAIWDSNERRLLLARDPLGVKPLYFCERPGFVAFASEAKALFFLGVKAEFDPVALDEALTWRYVPPPRSGFKDIEKLPPGNLAWAKAGVLEYRPWWDLPRVDAKAAELDEQLARAVKRRLVADVPLGAWLSGGIDSALVASKIGSGTKSFCAGFTQAEYDERALARLSAQALGTTHTDFEVPADIFRLLPQIVWHADEPFFDSSCLPTFVLSEMTKPHATVVLSGDGGDETFAGYDRYAGMQQYERYKSIPKILRSLALAYAKWRHPAASRQGWDRMLRWLEKCRQVELAGHHPYIAAMELLSRDQKTALYGPELLECLEGCDALDSLDNTLLRAKDTLERTVGGGVTRLSPGVLQRADLESYLPGDVLHKVDRMSMAHGLEVRSPFLDVDLATWALSLADKERLPGRQTKPLLRVAAAKVLPVEVIAARKRGFGVPLDAWFRGPLMKPALALFEDSHLVGDRLFKPRFWETLWREHQAQKAQHGERLYALVSLETWYRTFITGAVPDKRPAPLVNLGEHP
jgi:asparagine synthase (glutamine-hydrolysing)